MCYNVVITMEMKLEKQIVKVGNGAGVILPKEWLNGIATVELTRKPINPQEDVFKILKDKLSDVKGIYLTGSYARGDFDKKSDIDVLVITKETKGNIKRGRYDLLLIPYKDLDRILKKSIFPILPMIKESVTILNDELIAPYRKYEIEKKLVTNKLLEIKHVLEINREDIKLSKEANLKKIGDGTAYSLVLRLRELYILDCLEKDKRQSKKELMSLIKKVSGSLLSYEGYLNIKSNGKSKERLDIGEAEKIIEHMSQKL